MSKWIIPHRWMIDKRFCHVQCQEMIFISANGLMNFQGFISLQRIWHHWEFLKGTASDSEGKNVWTFVKRRHRASSKHASTHTKTSVRMPSGHVTPFLYPIRISSLLEDKRPVQLKMESTEVKNSCLLIYLHYTAFLFITWPVKC